MSIFDSPISLGTDTPWDLEYLKSRPEGHYDENLRGKLCKTMGPEYHMFNMIHGKYTGRYWYTYSDDTGPISYEVKLFNPNWMEDGKPTYYEVITEYNKSLFLKLADDGSVKGYVKKNLGYRDNHNQYATGFKFPPSYYPNPDPSYYGEVCWNHDFTAKVDFRETDAYFGNSDFLEQERWMNKMSGGSGVLPEYYGDKFNARAGKNFYEGQLVASSNYIGCYYSMCWQGGVKPIRTGIIWAKGKFTSLDISLADKYDVVNSTKPARYAHYIRDMEISPAYEWRERRRFEFDVPHLAWGLEPNTQYSIVPFAELEDGRYIYGTIRQASTVDARSVSKPYIPISTINHLLRSFDPETMILEKSIENGNWENMSKPYAAYAPVEGTILNYGVRIGETLDSMVEVPGVKLIPVTDYFDKSAKIIVPKGTLTFLKPDTEYRVEFYASNEAGTVRSFDFRKGYDTSIVDYLKTKSSYEYPQLSYLINYYDNNSIYITGKVESSKSALKRFGAVWSDSIVNPSIDSDKISGSKTFNPEINYTGALKLDNLEIGKLYNIRFYGENSYGIGYTQNIQIKALGVLPNISYATYVTNSSARIKKGLDIYNTAIRITESGIVVGKLPYPTVERDGIVKDSVAVNNVRTELDVTGLESGTQYYARAYCITEAYKSGTTEIIPRKVVYSEQVVFQTQHTDIDDSSYRLKAYPATNILANSATVVFSDFNEKPTNVITTGVAWWNPTTNTSSLSSLSEYDGYVEGEPNQPVTLTNLPNQTRVMARAFASTATGLITSENTIEFMPTSTPIELATPSKYINLSAVEATNTDELLNFPKLPVLGQVYDFNDRRWIWNGSAWVKHEDNQLNPEIESYINSVIEQKIPRVIDCN